MASFNSQSLKQDKLFYFTGKIRAFWKDKIFFLDQKNAAIVSFEDLYINGGRASQSDLHHLDAQVANSDWELAPNLHSYVAKYDSTELPPWPYKLKGKKLWIAHFAWIGPIPLEVEEEIQNRNVIYMPLTYYTGKLIQFYDDKILYGDHRNNVMVHLSDLCIHGHPASSGNALRYFNYDTPTIHSFVVSVDFLTNRDFEGPEPHLPTWPLDSYGPCTWVAKFAWQGEMPGEFRHQLSRFHKIKLTEWNSLKFFGRELPFKSKEIGQHEAVYSAFSVHQPLNAKGSSQHEAIYSVFHRLENTKSGENGTKSHVEPLLASTQKEASIVKGSLLLANHEYGLINSCLDVVVFSTENFYVNGDIFREGSDLGEFFSDKKVPLTVWIEPLSEPVLIFDVYVMWRAVCVWYGMPPKNMEAIKKNYDKGIIAGSVPDALNTASDNRYTLVLGEVVSVTHNLGLARAKVGKMTLDIVFKKKSVYIEGYRLRTKCSLMEVQSHLESGIWTFLVYPSNSQNESGKVTYFALAVWQFSYQHLVSSDLLYRILLEGGNSFPDCDQSEDDKIGQHMTGMIVKLTADYGIIETVTGTIEPYYIFFLPKDLYVDGNVLEGAEKISSVDRRRPINLYAHPTKRQEIKGFPVSMYATLIWMGRKPQSLTQAPSQALSDPSSISKDVSGGNQDNSLNTLEANSSEEVLQCSKESQNATQIDSSSSPVLERKFGRFVFLGDSYGIIRCDVSKTYGSFAVFNFLDVWVYGKRLELDETFHSSVISDNIYCDLLAYKIPKKKMDVYQVSLTAPAVWLGKKPSHIVLPTVECPVKAMESMEEEVKIKSMANPLQKKISDYVVSRTHGSEESSDIVGKIAAVSLKDADGDLTEGNVEAFLEITIDPKNPYTGKHVSGRLIKVMKTAGVAMWYCAAKGGEVYIYFSKKNLFVNHCPMGKHYKLTLAKSCNFYVIPMKHKTVGSYKVSLYATCGWIGSKPHSIPSPGEQDHAHISLENLYIVNGNLGKTVCAQIVKLMTNTGIACWRSPAHGGDIYFEFEKKTTCDTIRSYFENRVDSFELIKPCHFYVRPIEEKEEEGFILSLKASCGWVDKRPDHFPKSETEDEPTMLAEKLHVTPVSPEVLEAATYSSPSKIKREGIEALDSVVAEPKENVEIKEKKKKKNKAELWEEDSNTEVSMEGKIIELHMNVGRLEGVDGSQHFFSRENSYLYGVCLNNVELWHVLVQGKIFFFFFFLHDFDIFI